MKKLLPLVMFSILLLTSIGVQNVFANHTPPFSGTDLHCDFLTNLPIPGVSYSNCNLSGVDFSTLDLNNADLSGASLISANLLGIDFTDANLSTADLSSSSLISADLVGADLTNADLSDTDLTDADLTDANLFGADLTNADLTDAHLDCFNHPVCTTGSIVGGILIDIDYVSLYLIALGTNSVISGLTGMALASIIGPTVWFVYKRKN